MPHALWLNNAHIKLLEFRAGIAGARVFINADAVSSVQKDPDPNSTLTLITTQDGQEHPVQESLDEVVTRLRQ